MVGIVVLAVVFVCVVGAGVYAWWWLRCRIQRVEALLWSISPDTARRLERSQTGVHVGERWQDLDEGEEGV